jgi:hypothetical protein
LPLLEQVARALVRKGLALGARGRIMAAIAVHDELIARFGASTEAVLADAAAKARQLRATLLELARHARPAGTG